MKEKIIVFGGFLGSFFSNIFGPWDTGVGTLMLFMLIDYLMGMVNAIVFNNSPKTESGGLSSHEGLKGIVKKCFMICLLVVGYRIDLTFNVNYVRTGICTALIVNELISMLETYKLTGLKYPQILDKVIDTINNTNNTSNSH